MLLDALMPTCDASLAEHTIVEADRSTTFDAARDLDFLEVRTPILVAAMWVRGLPARLTHHVEAVPPTLVLSEETMPGLSLIHI